MGIGQSLCLVAAAGMPIGSLKTRSVNAAGEEVVQDLEKNDAMGRAVAEPARAHVRFLDVGLHFLEAYFRTDIAALGPASELCTDLTDLGGVAGNQEE